MAESRRILYTAQARTTGGRDGKSRTDDGPLAIRLAPPGAHGGGTNPEQLFAVGWSACYLSAIQFVTKKKRVPFPPDARDDIEIDLIQSGDSYTLQARHTVRLPGVETLLARQIVAEAHQICPYSKVTYGNMEVITNVITSPEGPKMDPVARRVY